MGSQTFSLAEILGGILTIIALTPCFLFDIAIKTYKIYNKLCKNSDIGGKLMTL